MRTCSRDSTPCRSYVISQTSPDEQVHDDASVTSPSCSAHRAETVGTTRTSVVVNSRCYGIRLPHVEYSDMSCGVRRLWPLKFSCREIFHLKYSQLLFLVLYLCFPSNPSPAGRGDTDTVTLTLRQLSSKGTSCGCGVLWLRCL